MKAKTMFNMLLGLGLVIALGVVTAGGLNQARAQSPEVDGAASVNATVGTAFSCQGRLVQNGSPVTGACDFQFLLWTAASGGTQVGSTVAKTGLTLQDGFFTTEVDFGTGAWAGLATFGGDARWLAVNVRCPAGSGSYTSLSGRVALNPAPYALSLRPGAVVAGDVASGATLTALNTTTGTSSSAVHGKNSSTLGTGVYGEVTSSSGTNYGVYGYSPAGHGVHGKVNSPDGYGVYSEGNAYVDGHLYWKAMPSYVSIATSAFIPELYNNTGHVEYDNEGYHLKNQSVNGEWYTAPAQLPHGAVVTELNVCWKDFSNANARLFLRRRSLAQVTLPADTMAAVDAVGTAGSGREGCWSDTTIDFERIDNAGYAYYLEVGLPDVNEDLELYGVSIAYETEQPY